MRASDQRHLGERMADSMLEIRNKAAGAVFALAQRTASKGRIDSSATPKKGWVPNPQDAGYGYILPAKLREALAYYDIAISIFVPEDPNRAFTVYTKALLLEDLGEFSEAESVFLSLTGTAYEHSGQKGARRCKGRREGTYDIRSEAQAGLAELAQKMGNKPGASDVLAAMQRAQDVLFTHLDTRRPVQVAANSEKSEEPVADEEAGAEVAQAFVNLLLDRDYAGARQLLHADLSKLTAKDLERSFESLFTEEEFPETANVFDAQRDWPDKRVEDVANFYVTIRSENAEAISVTVTQEGNALKIREIEWGRP